MISFEQVQFVYQSSSEKILSKIKLSVKFLLC
jgi:ABC-type bacteriocin/lantibiotic exporter with double-glycine peptidase domain